MKIKFQGKVPTVSVILPTHNRAKSILRAINSVLKQSFADLELIVVDDASGDNTSKLVERIQDKRLLYIKHPKQCGASAARNTGINSARGEYIAFQDSDDEWVSTKLKKQLDVFDSCPDIGAVFSPYLRIAHNNKCQQIPEKIKDFMNGDILAGIMGISFIGTPTLLVRRSELSRSGNFNENLKTLEEWELSIRLAKCCRFACIDIPLHKAYVTDESVSQNEKVMLQTQLDILELHKELYEIYPNSKAKVLTFIANRKCLSGKIKEGRLFFQKALRADRSNIASWLGLMLTYSGKYLYKLIVAIKRKFT